MRRLLKSFTAFSVIAMLLFSFCISVGAVEETHNSQDGLVASITTKKDGYQSNEDIDLTFATRAIEKGINVKSVSEILGHSTVKMTLEKYVHITMEQKLKDINKLNSFV